MWRFWKLRRWGGNEEVEEGGAGYVVIAIVGFRVVVAGL